MEDTYKLKPAAIKKGDRYSTFRIFLFSIIDFCLGFFKF